MTLQPFVTRTLTIVALCSLGALACDSTTEPEAGQEFHGGLLFDLTEEELVEIHAAYLADEDIELTRSRLTAPFDCALYDDFCAEVGEAAALEITGEVVDLAREGAPIEEIQARLEARIDEAVRELDHDDPEGELTFRGSGATVYHTQGDFRLGVRNGITSPLIGDRRAWTQAITWHFEEGIFPLLPMWQTVPATQICVNAGTNTQTYHYNGQELLLESINPANACNAGDNDLEISTWHDRNFGSGSAEYVLEVHGCATASINGLNFNKCATNYTEVY